VYPPPLEQGEETLAGWRGGWGVKILEDARHSSVLYVCKYFVVHAHSLSLYLVSIIMYKVVVYSLAERADTLLLFLFYPYLYSVGLWLHAAHQFIQKW
jgi:hypothetical protein